MILHLMVPLNSLRITRRRRRAATSTILMFLLITDIWHASSIPSAVVSLRDYWGCHRLDSAIAVVSVTVLDMCLAAWRMSNTTMRRCTSWLDINVGSSPGLGILG